MDNIPELQQLVRDQLARHLKLKTKLSTANVSGAQRAQYNKIPKPISLKFEPSVEYPRNNRLIRHTSDSYIKEDESVDNVSLGSISQVSSMKSSASRSKFPTYSKLHSTSNPSYRKVTGSGRLRKVLLGRIEPMQKKSSFEDENDDGTVASESVASIEDMFSATYLSKESTKKDLDGERFFISKIKTPRLLADDLDARYKSKDMVNDLIEDLSLLSVSSMETNESNAALSGTTGSLNEWKTLYEAEKGTFDSVALYAEVRYLELKAMEKQGPRSTKLKATVCADLMLKLCRSTGRYAKVMEPILWELLNSIFMDFPHRDGLMSGENSLKGLYTMHTYFDKYREQIEMYDDIYNELEMVQQGLKMSELVKKFQTVKSVFKTERTYMRNNAFMVWKGEVKRSKQRARIALRRALKLRWDRWRAFCNRYNDAKLVSLGEELDQKIHSIQRLLVLLRPTSQDNLTSNGLEALSDHTSNSRHQQSADRLERISGLDSDLQTVLSSSSIQQEIETVVGKPDMQSMAPGDTHKQNGDHSRTVLETVHNLMKPMRTVMTQTPDAWMTGINEQPFVVVAESDGKKRRSNERNRPALSRLNTLQQQQQSPPSRERSSDSRGSSRGGGARSRERTISFVSESSEGEDTADLDERNGVFKKEERKIAIGSNTPPVYKLESAAACQLIAYIYGMKVHDGWLDIRHINFHKCNPMLEYSKEILSQRYGLKRLADKFYKGLMACTLQEAIINKRLETFGMVCGLKLEGHKGGDVYTSEEISFFFRSLAIMFAGNFDLMMDCFNTFEIDREIVLEILPDLFPMIEKHDDELAKAILFEVVDLPRNSPGNDLEYKVNIDDLMSLIMDFCDRERKLDTDDEFLTRPLALVYAAEEEQEGPAGVGQENNSVDIDSPVCECAGSGLQSLSEML